MTEFDIQKMLFDKFKELNDFSGIDFLDVDENGNYKNVHFPNILFNAPDSKRYFEITFKSNEPSDVALMEKSQSRITGILYVDIITPQDAGEDESENIYKWITRLFNNADMDYIDIMKVYISSKGNEADHYRLLVAIEWTADIDKE